MFGPLDAQGPCAMYACHECSSATNVNWWLQCAEYFASNVSTASLDPQGSCAMYACHECRYGTNVTWLQQAEYCASNVLTASLDARGPCASDARWRVYLENTLKTFAFGIVVMKFKSGYQEKRDLY